MGTANAAEIRNEIERANQKFMEAFRQGNAAGLAALYTENGMVLPPNHDSVEGREQIKDFWQAVMNMGIKSVKLQIGEVEQHGDTAIEMSRATLYIEGDQEVDQSKYIVIWKRENGEWKLHRDIFNSNLQAQG
ncbi:SgcJ/EcaC family oxidoreductase [Pontibacter diazotrophicus]|uniref:SgcJ/EcaC family oxidoreductase n=2 Tax=Pontibacter diazotrophicus TaxID=1400979 RepID=A0A3D8LAS0_9BACT|nr:SgcJ/EcaC family oxidoreductase [Pontibacter diazotrophicus]